MSRNKQQQEAHGIGQIEEQLRQQAEAAESIQGTNSTDREIIAEANSQESELDDVIEP